MDSDLINQVGTQRRREIFFDCSGDRRRGGFFRSRATNLFTLDLPGTLQALYGEREESKELGKRSTGPIQQ